MLRLLFLRPEHSAPRAQSLACSCSFLSSPWPWWPPPPCLRPLHQTNPAPAAGYPWSLGDQHLWRADQCEVWSGKRRRRGFCCAAASRRRPPACCRLRWLHPQTRLAQSETVGAPREPQAPSVTPTSWTCGGRSQFKSRPNQTSFSYWTQDTTVSDQKKKNPS